MLDPPAKLGEKKKGKTKFDGYVSPKIASRNLYVLRGVSIPCNNESSLVLRRARYTDDILLDTGCVRLMVRRNLVPPILPGDAVTIQTYSAHGDHFIAIQCEANMCHCYCDGIRVKNQ